MQVRGGRRAAQAGGGMRVGRTPKAQRDETALGGHREVSPPGGIRAVATREELSGENQLQPGAGSGRRDPAPGTWARDVPEELPRTPTAQEREVALGAARSPPVPGCTLRLAKYLLVDKCSLPGEAAPSTGRLWLQS